jgi:hypothetical protein
MANATGGGTKHYGSLYTTTDYTTNVTMVNGALTITPATNLLITFGTNYSVSKADFDPVIMPQLSDELQLEIDTEIGGANYDYSQIHTYSDLSYKRLDGSLKVDYRISDGFNWSAEIIYIKLTDDNGYVYGDETGSIYIIRSGLEFGL